MKTDGVSLVLKYTPVSAPNVTSFDIAHINCDDATGSISITVTGSPTIAWRGPGGFTSTVADIFGFVHGVLFVRLTTRRPARPSPLGAAAHFPAPWEAQTHTTQLAERMRQRAQ